MILTVIRGMFLFLAVCVTTFFLLSMDKYGPGVVGVGYALSICTALFVIYIDMRVDREHKIATFSGVLLGMLAGLLFAYALSFVVDLIGLMAAEQFHKEMADPENPLDQSVIDLGVQGAKLFIGLVTCYIGVSVVMQTKDDFRFAIPYVEFTKQLRGSMPTLLDSSVIVDGRIVDIAQTHVLQGTVIVPQFVVNELQLIADSEDKLKRARGRRGLDILKALQDDSLVDLRIEEKDVPGNGVDQKLVSLAVEMQARLMTNDFNLNKAATLKQIQVINLNDLAQAMRPVALPGEEMRVKIVKNGEGQEQGVGYLDDGTMVVVEGARDKIDQTLTITITSTLQTSAGKMIFAKV